MYVLACDQCGPSYLGESIAVDPMGVSVGGGSEEEELIPVRIDTDRIKSVRKKLFPSSFRTGDRTYIW